MPSQPRRVASWLMNLWSALILLIFFAIRTIGFGVGR